MGLLKRLHKAVNGVGGAINAVVGIPLDIVRAPFRDDEFDGIIGTVYGTVANRGAQFFSNALGPEGFGGSVIGALPAGVRDPASSVINPVLTGLETAYREGIAEPLSTALTVGSLSDAPGGGGIAGLVTPQNWSRAYRIAQHRSPGQALALMGTKNITDEAEIAKYTATDKYNIISGVADAASRIFLDPTVIGGKAATATRLKLVTKPITGAEDIERALRSPRLAKFNDAISTIKRDHPDTAAAIIRDRFFPDHDAGALISTVLADAKTETEQWWGLRALMGDQEAATRLHEIRARISPAIDSLTREADQLGPVRATTAQPLISPVAPNLFADDLARIETELKPYLDVDSRVQRMQAGFASIREVPKVGKIGDIRTRITRSDFYQNTTLGESFQSFFHMTAHPIVNLGDQRGDIQIDRMLAEAELPREARDAWRSAYMEAPDQATRHSIAIAAEKDAIAHIASRAGMRTDELEEILANIAKGRGEAQDLLSKRVYDQNGHSVLHYQNEMGDWEEVAFPPSVTQDHTLLPLVNMRELKAASTRFGEFRAAHPSANIPGAIADRFNRIWKPAVLLRPAWPIRVVGDEQFRIIAKIGAVAQLDNLMTGFRDYTTDFISAAREKGLANIVGKDNRATRQAFGVREFNYKGYDMEGVFGTPDDIRRHTRELASASRSWEALHGDREQALLRQFREAGQNFRSVMPDHPAYADTYNWAVERLRSHPIGAQIAAGLDDTEIVRWLQSTPEGRDVLASHSIKATNARNWVEEVRAEVDKYTVDGTLIDEFRDKTLNHSLLSSRVDPAAQPLAHGELVNQALGTGFISQMIPNIVNGLFDKLGRLPTDIFSRNPYMGHMYRAEVKRQIDLLGDRPMTNAIKTQIEERARNYSLNETQKLLYDLSEQSRFGEILGFISPFYNAWQEVITRWTGLAIENPAFIARARLVWNAPEKAGLVTDEAGREIKSGDTYSDNPADPNYRGKDRLIALPVPPWVKGLPGMKGIAEKDRVAFNKKSMNLVLQGFPSVGPLVQIPVNEIVKSRPELADSVKAILPFGPTYDLKSMLLPSTAKYALSAAEQDEKYQSALLRIYFDKLTDVQTGKRDKPADDKVLYEEAVREAQAFTHLRAVSAYTLPVAPTFFSPYQPQIDAFRQGLARYNAAAKPGEENLSLADKYGNPRTPEEWFLDEHGEEYFALTQAVTKSLNGVPPTLEAYEKSKQYSDLLQDFPELGSVILGQDSGEFNSAVYNYQKNTQLRPGSENMQREIIPFEEASVSPDRRLGWIKYRRFMDLIEATRIQRGLPNLQVAAAKDLAAVKSAFTTQLMLDNPAWRDDFNQTDKGKWDRKIEALRTISSRPEMQDRDDMKGIRDYLKARDMMTALLTERGKQKNGAKTLNASSNQDLATAWHALTGMLIERSLAFSEVFYHHLENDPLGL